MSTNISDLSVAQLKQAVQIKEQIERLERELASITGSGVSTPAPKAKSKAAKPAAAPKSAAGSKARKPMSAAAKARLSALAKQRWANAKASGKTAL